MKKYLNTAIILAFMILFGFLPPIGALTPFGMQVLGIFLGCIYAWTKEIIIWPCIAALILLATVQGQNILSVIQICYGNQLIWQIMWVLICCYSLEKIGLIPILGNWVASLKIVRKGPYWMLFAFWLASYIGNALTFANVAIVLILWSIFYKIMDQIGIRKYSAYANILMIGIAIFGYLGSVVPPYGLWPQIISGMFVSMGYQDLPSFANYLLFTGVLSIVYFIAAIAITKFILRPKIDFDVSAILINEHTLTFSRTQKIALASLALLVVFLILPQFLPKSGLIVTWMNNMGLTAGFIFIVLLLSALPSDTDASQKAINLADVIKNGINWNTFFMLSTAFYIATLITSDSTGILTVLKNILTPMLGGRSGIASIFILCVFGAMMTNCLNNVVSATLIIPVTLIFCTANNINPTLMIMAYSVLLIQGCFLPSGSVLGGILHANSAYLKAKDVYRYTLLFTLLLALLTALLCTFMPTF